MNRKKSAVLVLEDGSIFRGWVFAGDGTSFGEVVFNTGMTGYQEILTDPSYKEQILVMTYPLIGNYGINTSDMESARIHMEGFILREYHDFHSNWRACTTLRAFLEDNGKVGIEGIDTRAVTRKIRTEGAMRGVVSSAVDHVDDLLEQVRAYPGLIGRDIVTEVSCSQPYVWNCGSISEASSFSPKGERFRVVVLDYGVKFNILRSLEQRGCEVIVVPASTSSHDILLLEPDGILLSNGPGDPAPLKNLVETVKDLLGSQPVFGICLGHQILGQALGARTEKLKFGHHGVNQPVKNLKTGRIEISSQNHGFVVVTETLPADTQITHINLNDNTLEGLFYPSMNAFSVQYHPEASPGPSDSRYLFDTFMEMLSHHRKKSGLQVH
ncbi:MAG: glutamine-hydrolyzing carbamoyl-phosphate synthase small subunit [Desulfomonilia bacterium]